MGDGTNWICSLAELADVVGAKTLSQSQSRFSYVGTDSRSDLSGKLFIALRGDRYNAHDYIPQAVRAGAAAALVSEWRDEWSEFADATSFLLVNDTLLALQTFARHWRRKHGFTVLAITGSNGKTTTKEFTRDLLSPHFKIHASKGSFNNHWGVPLSILEATPDHTHLILEMGMNHTGEIWKLCQIAEPDVAVVTTVGRAHVGELGSVEAIARAKEEIYVATPKAVQVFNGDNEWTMRMLTRSFAKKIVFSSFHRDSNIQLRAEKADWQGLSVTGHIMNEQGNAAVPVLGRQNVVNLMAAAGLAVAVGLTPEQVWKGLGKIKDTAWGRNQILQLKNGARVLFDAYNANPDSMQALIKNLLEVDCEGEKSLILGDMRELGEFSEKAHEEIGEKVASQSLCALWYVGEFSSAFMRGFNRNDGKAGKVFTSKDVESKIASEVLTLLKPGDILALKASRGIGLERVLEGWPLATPLGKKD